MTSLVPALQFLAAFAGALFAGAALYINVAEHPARMGLDTGTAARQWAPSYRRATWLQAPLALLSLVCGAGAWALGAGVAWLIAALLVGSVVPVTFIVIMPTNRKLLAPGRDLGSVETRDLLVRWGRLHAIRTILSLGGAALYLCCSPSDLSLECHREPGKRRPAATAHAAFSATIRRQRCVSSVPRSSSSSKASCSC